MAKPKELTPEEILSGFQNLTLKEQLEHFEKIRKFLSDKKQKSKEEFQLIEGANIEAK